MDYAGNPFQPVGVVPVDQIFTVIVPRTEEVPQAIVTQLRHCQGQRQNVVVRVLWPRHFHARLAQYKM